METRRSTRIASGVNVMSPPSLWKVDTRLPCALQIPPIWYTKSICQVARRNSPSVDRLKPDLLLQRDRLADGPVLNRPQLLGRDRPGRPLRARRVQPRRPQQAPHMISPERRHSPR